MDHSLRDTTNHILTSDSHGTNAMAETLTHRAYEHICEHLANGKIDVTQRISTNAVAKQLGISRSPVRDAINQLSTEGLLKSVAKSGVFVKSLPLEDIKECLDMRVILEPYAAARAAKRITNDQLDKLRESCAQMRSLSRQAWGDQFQDEEINQQLFFTDVTFHQIILEASGNRRLKKTVEINGLLLRKSLLLRMMEYPSGQFLRARAVTLLEHWWIYRALQRGSANDARYWMRVHIKRVKRRIIKACKEPRRAIVF